MFDTDLSFYALRDALKSGGRPHFLGTIEFYPEEGKYHLDGHRSCGVRLEPRETRAYHGMCPECGKPVTIGGVKVGSYAHGNRDSRSNPPGDGSQSTARAGDTPPGSAGWRSYWSLTPPRVG